MSQQPWGQLWAPAAGLSMNVTPAMGPSMGVTSVMGTSYGHQLWDFPWMAHQPWGPSTGTSHGCGAVHRDWLWGRGMGTGHGDPLWGYPWGLAMGWGGGQKHHPSVSPCVPWGCQSGCDTPVGVPSQAVSIVTRSPPCHPGPRGAWGSVLPELSPFPMLPTWPLQGFALLVLRSLLLSPNSLFLPAASTAALSRRLGFLPLPSSPWPSSPFGCQM